jgi:transposase
MALGKPRDPRKEQQWRRWLHRWQHSGLSVRAFCARHHLPQPSFYAWRRTLQQRDATAAPFLPVHVVPEQEPATASSFEIVLADGRRLRVTPGFDPATLRQLLVGGKWGRFANRLIHDRLPSKCHPRPWENGACSFVRPRSVEPEPKP